MAIRTKTIEYVFQTSVSGRTAGLGTSLGRYDGQPVTIYIPETGVTFTNVSLQVFVAGYNTTTGNLTAPKIGLKLGGYPTIENTITAPNANSGELEAWMLGTNFTSTFSRTWTGNTTNNTAIVTFTGSTIITNNQSAKLFITYQYNDDFRIQVKTIRYPIESQGATTLSTLTTTAQRLNSGTTASPAQGYPDFKSYLPEAGITVRQEWIELWGNEATNATTNFDAQLRISGSTLVTFWGNTPVGTSLNSARWAYGIVDTTATGRTLTQAVPLEAQVITTTARMNLMGGMACCTYEYDVTGSTTIYNSLLIGGIDTSGWLGGTGFTDKQVWERNIYIEEPNPIVLKESALCGFINDLGGFAVIMNVTGSTTGQTEQTYTMTAGALQCGQYSWVHRIDSYGQNGKAGLVPKRGANQYRVQIRSNTAIAGWNVSAFLLLNYTSGKHALGPGVHAHTCYHFVQPEITVQTSGSIIQTSGATMPSIESQYYLVGLVFGIQYSVLLTTATASGIIFNAEILYGESTNDGCQELYKTAYRTDSENENMSVYTASRNDFKRWPGDPDPDRLDLTQARNYRLDSPSSLSGYFGMYYTYNGISYTVSGTCSGFGGDGSGIPVDVFRINTSTGEEDKILNLTTAVGGTFSGQWIDNTDTLFAVARQDNTHVGRSGNYQAG